MAYSKDVVDLIEDLRNRTTSNITSIHTGLVPEFLNTRWSIVNHYFYDGIRYNNYDQDMTFFKLNNIRYWRVSYEMPFGSYLDLMKRD